MLLHKQHLISLLVAAAFLAMVMLRVPKVWNSGDFELPLEHARMLISGQDPLAEPPQDGRFIPYPLTAATLLITINWMPSWLVSALIVCLALSALWLLRCTIEPNSPWWTWMLPLAYVPLLFNITIIQWAPMLLFGLVCGIILTKRHQEWFAGIAWLTLFTKAQLVSILAMPFVLTLVLTRRWQALVALLAGWTLLLCVSLVLQPNWPFVWWEQTRPYRGGYISLALAVPYLGLPLVGASIAFAYLAWRRGLEYHLLASLIIIASLLTPQRALYEATVLVIPIVVLMSNWRLATVVIACSWLIPLQPLLGIGADLMLVLTLFIPVVFGLWLHIWRSQLLPVFARQQLDSQPEGSA